MKNVDQTAADGKWLTREGEYELTCSISMIFSLVSMTMASSLLDDFFESLLAPEWGDVASIILVRTVDTPPRDLNTELLPVKSKHARR